MEPILILIDLNSKISKTTILRRSIFEDEKGTNAGARQKNIHASHNIYNPKIDESNKIVFKYIV